MDLTPAITALLSGGMEGYNAQLGRQKEAANTALLTAKAQRDNAKTDADMMNQGLRYNPTSKAYELDPTFMAGEQPNPSAVRGANAAGANGLPAPSDPNAPPAPAPIDNSSYRRVKMVENLKALGSGKGLQNPLTLRAVYAIRNPGKALPSELEPYGDVNYDPKYDSLFTQGQPKPGQTPASIAATRAYEKAMNLPEGSMDGVSMDKLASGMSNVAGQSAAAGRTATTLQSHEKMTQAQIAAANDRAEAERQNKGTLQDKEIQSKKDLEAYKLEHTPKKVDSKLAGKYNDYVSGDREAALGVIRDLEDSRDKLRARGDSSWQSYAPGLVPYLDKDLEQIKTNIGDAASTGLKERFGSRISNLELQNAMKFSYNPHLTETQNADILDKHIAQAKSKVAEKDKWAKYYENNNGDLKGYSGLDGSGDQGGVDAPEDAGPPLNPSQVRAKAAQTGGAAVNGAVIPKKTLNDIRQYPTKGTAAKPQLGAVKTTTENGKKVNWLRTTQGWEEQR